MPFFTLYIWVLGFYFLLAVMYGLLYFTCYSCNFEQYNLLFQHSLNGRVLIFSFSKGLQCQSSNFSEFCNHLLAILQPLIILSMFIGLILWESMFRKAARAVDWISKSELSILPVKNSLYHTGQRIQPLSSSISQLENE